MRKGIFQRQRDATDCGAACLASIAAYYGLRIPVSLIRQFAGTDKLGTNLYGLMEAAKRLHFQAKAVKANPANLAEIPLPAISHMVQDAGLQHFVVLYRINRNHVFYMDPASGKIVRQSSNTFKKAWTGVLMLLLPEANFRRENQHTAVFKRFRKLIDPHRIMIAQALFGAMAYTILGLATSIYVEKIVDFVIPDENRKLMNLLGVIMIIILLFQIGTGYFKSLIMLRTGQQIDAQLILGYYRHLMGLPQTFFDSMRVGEIISRVNDAVKIRAFINDTALYMIIHMMTMIFSVAAMFLYCWRLALAMLLMIPVYLLLYIISNRINAKWQRKMMETGAAMESQLVESISGAATIKRFGAENYFSRQTEKKLIPLMRAVYNAGKSSIGLGTISELSTRLMTIIILWIGSYFVMDRQLSPGALLSFYALAGFFTTPVQALIGMNKNMQDALIAADRLFEIIDLETEKTEASYCALSAISPGNIEFRNVQFRYGFRTKVFDGLNLTIEKHQITAILGESGSGKSTLFSLIQRLYPLNEGSIFIGGTDIRYTSHVTLRRMIVAVPQQTDLFKGTLMTNIALGEEDPDMETVLQLCRRLGLEEFINELPGQYDAEIQEQGLNLSGGQRQRIAIARALYRNPEILILDEATSALDPESEQKVNETIQWFHGQKKTVIYITHRLSTLKGCHRVILLKDGKLAAQGSHENLIAEHAEYAKWWKANGQMW